MSYWVKFPQIFPMIFPKLLWKMQTEEKKIFLTFDDGPHPQATDFVLQQLAKYEAKATFFFIGKNVLAHPEMAKDVLSAGHSIGNHTFTHCNGWKTKKENYLADFQKCQENIEDTLGISPTYFRPPYGKITISQANAISQTHKIAMMDILCGDFDLRRNANQCTQDIIRYAEKGSIVVYHDSEKASLRMMPSLPAVLSYFHQEGWSFGKLE